MGDTLTENNVGLEIYELEKAYGKELKCEMSHANSPCSIEVTHLGSDCRKQWFMCAIAHELAVDTANELDTKCKHCKQLAVDCWNFVGI